MYSRLHERGRGRREHLGGSSGLRPLDVRQHGPAVRPREPLRRSRRTPRFDIVHPKAFKEDDDIQRAAKKTLELLKRLNGHASPAAVGDVMRGAVEEGSGESMATDRTEARAEVHLAAFAPQPTILPVSDILFDAWALTTIRDKLPGRPPVEPYLHGVGEWEPPETHVAWREEVGSITEAVLARATSRRSCSKTTRSSRTRLLRDRSDRVFERLEAIAERHRPVGWLVDDDGTVEVITLAMNSPTRTRRTASRSVTILLPPTSAAWRRDVGRRRGRPPANSTWPTNGATTGAIAGGSVCRATR